MNRSATTRAVQTRSSTRAFTLIELLVVITIIAVLIGILVPVIGKVRIASQAADTKNWLSQLSGAIERYQQDFHAYPGPIANNEIALPAAKSYMPLGNYTTLVLTTVTGFDTTSQTSVTMPQTWTMSENLVLGLLGGLHQDATIKTQLDYDPSAVGSGPTSLNTVGLPKRYPAYIDAKQLSWQIGANGKSGHYFDAAGSANDSIIPEFVDRFADPMPILYMRAKVGSNPAASTVSAGTFTNYYNPIVTNDLSEVNATDTGGNYLIRQGQYDISQISAYTSSTIGVGRNQKVQFPGNHGLQMLPWANPSLAPTAPTGPNAQLTLYDAYPYFTGSAGTPREKDAYILISAGADRVYGTADDITNFGTVGE